MPTLQKGRLQGQKGSKAVSSKGHVGSRSHWGGILPGFTWTILIMSLGVLPAAGQQAATLQQQLEQLKQEYETSTQALQLRMATLEQQIQSQKESQRKGGGSDGLSRRPGR